jgi:hypothetical protein
MLAPRPRPEGRGLSAPAPYSRTMAEHPDALPRRAAHCARRCVLVWRKACRHQADADLHWPLQNGPNAALRRAPPRLPICCRGSAMLAAMPNPSANRYGRQRAPSWRTPIADVPTDGPAEMVFEALLPIPGQVVYWLLIRRRIAYFCLRIPDRQKAGKLYRELMAICERPSERQSRTSALLPVVPSAASPACLFPSPADFVVTSGNNPQPWWSG